MFNTASKQISMALEVLTINGQLFKNSRTSKMPGNKRVVQYLCLRDKITKATVTENINCSINVGYFAPVLKANGFWTSM